MTYRPLGLIANAGLGHWEARFVNGFLHMRSTEVLTSKFAWIGEKRRTLSVSETERVRVDGAWSEGSRSLHEARNPETGARLSTPALEDRFSTTAFDKGKSGGYASTSPGLAYLEQSNFRGSSYLRLHLHPADYQRLVVDSDLCTLHEDCKANPEMARLCPGKGTIPERDKRILAAYRMKAGDYRKAELQRAGATAEDVERFVSAGWLSRNRAGATSLTPLGRTLTA